MKKNFITFSIIFLFFLMLAFPSVTKQAANEGLELWIFTVLPALLPYTIISSLLLCLNAFNLPCKIWYKIFKKKLPENELLVVICGYMCGCPIGAKLAADLYINQRISKNTAEFLMCACNNLSPSFLINYVFVVVYAPFVQLDNLMKFGLFIIIIFSSLLGALITHYMYKKHSHAGKSLHSNKKAIHTNTNPAKNISLSASINTKKSIPKENLIAQKKSAISKILEDCILQAFEIQSKIGGYIILFTIITNLFLHTLDISKLQAACLGSMLEVTSGLGLFSLCTEAVTYLSPVVILALITALTTFGGLCTIFQTKTVISNSGLSITRYGISKLIGGGIAFIFAIILIR